MKRWEHTVATRRCTKQATASELVLFITICADYRNPKTRLDRAQDVAEDMLNPLEDTTCSRSTLTHLYVLQRFHIYIIVVKTKLFLCSPAPFLGIKVKQEESAIRLFLKL